MSPLEAWYSCQGFSGRGVRVLLSRLGVVWVLRAASEVEPAQETGERRERERQVSGSVGGTERGRKGRSGESDPGIDAKAPFFDPRPLDHGRLNGVGQAGRCWNT